MMWIVKLRSVEPVYVSLEPTLQPEVDDFCITFAWTYSKSEAVRFTTSWHAKAVVGALRRSGRGAVVVKVST